MFVVSEVLNASGGRTGCFLYRGRLMSAAPRAATPDYCCPALHGGDGVLAGVQEVPQMAQCDGEAQDLLQYEGQQLTLYFRCVAGLRARSGVRRGWAREPAAAATCDAGTPGPRSLAADPLLRHQTLLPCTCMPHF